MRTEFILEEGPHLRLPTAHVQALRELSDGVASGGV
jgi:hypothetical protein